MEESLEKRVVDELHATLSAIYCQLYYSTVETEYDLILAERFDAMNQLYKDLTGILLYNTCAVTHVKSYQS